MNLSGASPINFGGMCSPSSFGAGSVPLADQIMEPRLTRAKSSRISTVAANAIVANKPPRAKNSKRKQPSSPLPEPQSSKMPATSPLGASVSNQNVEQWNSPHPDFSQEKELIVLANVGEQLDCSDTEKSRNLRNQRAELLLFDHNFQSVEELYRTTNKMNSVANIFLGEAALYQGKYENAQKFFETALQEDPDLLVARIRNASSLRSLGCELGNTNQLRAKEKYRLALCQLEIFKDTIEADGGPSLEPNYLGLRAEIFLDMGDNKEAMKEIQLLQEHFPKSLKLQKIKERLQILGKSLA